MADTDDTDSQATEPNESDEEEEYKDTEDEDDASVEEQVDTSPHSSDGERTCESKNSYLARVRERQRVVHQRLIELGLVSRNNTGGGMLSRHEENSSTSAPTTPVATNQTTPTTNPPNRKSPRLTQTSTETTNVPVRSTRCSPRLATMNLRSPVHYDLAESEEDEEYEDETVKRNIGQNVSKNINVQRTYADVCKNTYRRTGVDTRHLVFNKDPGLLLKLQNVAKQCFSKGKKLTS